MKASSVRYTNSEKQFVGKSIESGIVRNFIITYYSIV